MDPETHPETPKPTFPVEALATTCKLPQFWRTNPELWFLQVEAVLNTHRIKGDESKYNLVVAVLDPDTIANVADILQRPPADGKYDALKAAILHRMTESTDQKLNKFLAGTELGEYKPSHLLRKLRALAGTHVSENLLRIKWLDSLPSPSQRLLKVLKGQSLEDMAEIADEICAESLPVMATSLHNTIPPSEELAALRHSVQRLERKVSEQSDPRRNREITPHQRRHDRLPNQFTTDMCWYHRTFGSRARRCDPPCSFVSTATLTSTQEN